MSATRHLQYINDVDFKETVLRGPTGINYEIARMFLLHWYKVCIVSRKLPNIEKAVAQLKLETPGG